MTPSFILLLLRLLSALLLLGFFGVIVWLIYQDMRTVAATLADQERQLGYLRVVDSESGEPAVDTRYPLLPVTSIGRATSNTLTLEDNYASGEHALITRRGRQWWLEDLNSRNGTLLNELPLEGAAVVSAGDVITIGGTKFKIEL